MNYSRKLSLHARHAKKQAQKDGNHLSGLVSFVIPAAGVEPARPRGHWILSPARLPIPPRRHNCEECNVPFCCYGKAVTGFEPVIEVLQTCALPLGYTAEMLLFEKTGLAGFEPTNDRVKVCCLTAWR